MTRKYEKVFLYISIIILLIMTFIEGELENPCVVKIVSVLIVLIQTGYAVIPFFIQHKQIKNRSVNRLTQNTFTDREGDIENILNKLSIKEHIIEIDGDDKGCGKTWIAKKLVDYINYPKDKKIIKNRLPYKSAYYLDLDFYNEQQLESFLNNTIINTNVVLVFDNVKNFNYLLSKQALYHFQLIYILKKTQNNYYFKHTVSKFEECHIKELHGKIRYNFPGIQNISEDEVKVLYRLTNGNIGKIASILSKQISVKRLKDIASSNQTDYDEKLNAIDLILYTGQYESALKELKIFAKQHEEYFQENNELFFKYIMLKSDCEHLLNHYEEALTLLSIIENEPYYIYNKDNKIELYKAHYLKHLWACDEALLILYKIKNHSFSAKVDSLGILLAKHFVGDEHVPYNDRTSLEEFCNIYSDAQNDNICNQDISARLKHQRYTAIYQYYNEQPRTLNELIKPVSEVIHIYKSQNNRLLANAYFVRGEIYRLHKKYEEAVKDYMLCLSVTDDNNIILQTNLMMLYLTKCKKINIAFNILSHDKIIDLCRNNNYGQKVLHRINSILIGDAGSELIIQCFETNIMPIL